MENNATDQAVPQDKYGDFSNSLQLVPDLYKANKETCNDLQLNTATFTY